jgi:hypothetical protein
MKQKLFYLILLVLVFPACYSFIVFFKEQLPNLWMQKTIPSKDALHLYLLLLIPLWLSIRWIIEKYFFRINSFFSFSDTLEHELAHAFIGLLFFKTPSRLMASAKGNGFVELAGSNAFILLAPYYLPFWSFIVLCLSLLVKSSAEIYFLSVAIVLWANFWFRLKNEIHKKQSDLQEGGFVISLFLVSATNILISGLWLQIYFSFSWSELAKLVQNKYIWFITFIPSLF